MQTVETRRIIAASPQEVWAVLTDPARILAANMGILRLEGRIATGQTIRLESSVAPGRVFALKVEEVTPPQRMVWSSGAALIFHGRRTITLTPHSGSTEFHMAEVYRGLMLPLIWRSMPDMQPGFERFADGLKQAVEG